jgi:hypothetical protein
MIGIRRITLLLLTLAPCCCVAQSSTAVVLHGGTSVSLAFAGPVDSRTAAAGDRIDVVLAKDITADGAVVAKAGTKLSAVVTSVKRAALAGRSGEISLRLEELAVGDTKIRLSGSKQKSADTDLHFSRAYHMKWPMGLARTGDNVEINSGTLLTVYVAEDASIAAGN